jgi:hypothetical protein
MAEFPLGAIAMFFSVVEGSMALLSRLGVRYAEAVPAERAILRGLFCGCGHAGYGEHPGGWLSGRQVTALRARAGPGRGARIGRLPGEAS